MIAEYDDSDTSKPAFSSPWILGMNKRLPPGTLILIRGQFKGIDTLFEAADKSVTAEYWVIPRESFIPLGEL